MKLRRLIKIGMINFERCGLLLFSMKKINKKTCDIGKKGHLLGGLFSEGQLHTEMSVVKGSNFTHCQTLLQVWVNQTFFITFGGQANHNDLIYQTVLGAAS